MTRKWFDLGPRWCRCWCVHFIITNSHCWTQWRCCCCRCSCSSRWSCCCWNLVTIITTPSPSSDALLHQLWFLGQKSIEWFFGNSQGENMGKPSSWTKLDNVGRIGRVKINGSPLGYQYIQPSDSSISCQDPDMLIGSSAGAKLVLTPATWK